MKKPATKTPFKCAVVAVVGRPNAGKSTLVNELLGTPLSAVSARPNTTRTSIHGVVQLYRTAKANPTSWNGQLVLVDTPGLNFERGLLERSMHASVEDAMEEVDTVLWVHDARSLERDLDDLEQGLPGEDRFAAWLRTRLSENSKAHWVLALNKVDMMPLPKVLPLIERAAKLLPQVRDIVPVAAVLGRRAQDSNLDRLLSVLRDGAPEQEALYPMEAWTNLNDKQVVQNLIREAIFQLHYKEVPYQVDCSIESWIEPSGKKKMPECDANLWVARPSLKPILVGKGGSRIKEIGIKVRQRYKDITGVDLVLRLFVKVVENWDRKAQQLTQLGYGANTASGEKHGSANGRRL